MFDRLIRRSAVFAAVVALVVGISAAEPVVKKEQDAKAAGAAKPASGNPADEPKKDGVLLGAKPGTKLGPGELLKFNEAQAAAQMGELEERMFRLSEALKQLEPENSSRLLLGLKYAREELIVHNMQQTQQLLGELKLSEAIGEQQQVLIRLQRLHELLLSEDLDFHMRLARLKQLRKIIGQVDKAIGQEQGELSQSRDMAARQRQKKGLRKRQRSLEDLIARQKTHKDESLALAKKKPAGDDAKKAAAALAEKQQDTMLKTRLMAAEDKLQQKKASELNAAAAQMAKAADSLGKAEPAAAAGPQQQAIDSLEKARQKTAAGLRRLEKNDRPDEFDQMQRDQRRTRSLTRNIAQDVRKLGSSGVRALSELTRSAGSMSQAEGSLEEQQAEPAGLEQERALQSLKVARQDLEHERQALQDALREEVKPRVLEALRRMAEQQKAVRESTEKLQAPVARGSRDALVAAAGLSTAERRIIAIIDESIELVEETEFGIALPAALRAIRGSMNLVAGRLDQSDCSAAVVTQEKQIEADLATMLDAMKQMPASRGRGEKPRQQNDPRQQERELNRLIAELKMIRMLQIRVNSQTVDVDDSRAGQQAALEEAIRERVQAIEKIQDDVRKTTEKLGKQRGA